jgi:murein DD-endopeptidase MepM/ murein hydrolase activator NlpD
MKGALLRIKARHLWSVLWLLCGGLLSAQAQPPGFRVGRHPGQPYYYTRNHGGSVSSSSELEIPDAWMHEIDVMGVLALDQNPPSDAGFSEPLLKGDEEEGVEEEWYEEPDEDPRAMMWPVDGQVTSPYGWRHSRRHTGVDIGAPRGTPVLAALSGEVVFSGWSGAYGNMVILEHADGLMTVYAHHEANLVSKGDKVKGGDVIGRVGTTGRADGPHVHFEVRRGSYADNPMLYLTSDH